MPLRANWDDFKDRPGYDPIVWESMVFATMAIGWGEITEENAGEWYLRIHAWQCVKWPFMHRIDPDTNEVVGYPITPEHVRWHIGLRTNAFPRVTDAEFAKRLVADLRETGRYRWKNATGQELPHDAPRTTRKRKPATAAGQ